MSATVVQPALQPPGQEMTIVHAQAWQAWLASSVQSAISRGDAVVHIDLGEVCEVDSCGLQVLLSARKTLQRHHGSLCIGPASAVVRESLGRFGFGVASDGALCLSAQPAGAQP